MPGVVLLAAAGVLGVGVVLLGQAALYLLGGLVGIGIVVLAGLAVWRTAVRLGWATIALAGSWLLFGALGVVIGAKLGGVKASMGLVVRVQGVGAGAAILPFAAVALAQPFVRRRMGRPRLLPLTLAGLVVLGALTTAIGALQGNDLGYVLGDAYKFVLAPIVFLTCTTFVKKAEQWRFLWRFAALSGLLLSLVGMVIQFYKLGVGWRYRLGADIDIYALAVAVLLYASHPRRKVRGAALLAVVGLVVAAVVSLERRDWVYVAMVWALALTLSGTTRSRLRLLYLAVAGCVLLLAVVAALYLLMPDVLSGTVQNLEQRIAYTLGGTGADTSVTRRLDEVDYIVQELRDSAAIHWAIGLGQGAEFHDPWSGKAGSLPWLVHNVHNTYVGVVFRTGIAGLLLVAAFVVLSLGLARQCIRHARREGFSLDLVFLQAALIYLMVVFVVEWNVAPSLGDIQTAVVIGLLGSVRLWQQRSSVSNAVGLAPGRGAEPPAAGGGS